MSIEGPISVLWEGIGRNCGQGFVVTTPHSTTASLYTMATAAKRCDGKKKKLSELKNISSDHRMVLGAFLSSWLALAPVDLNTAAQCSLHGSVTCIRCCTLHRQEALCFYQPAQLAVKKQGLFNSNVIDRGVVQYWKDPPLYKHFYGFFHRWICELN